MDFILKKQDIYWMNKAIFLAKDAEIKGEIPIGAVLIYKNKLIGKGSNNSILSNDPSAHAEIIALRNGGKYLKNYRLLNTTLYVTLEPCIMCIGAIIHSRIKRLVYGSSDSKIKTTSLVMHFLKNFKMNHYILISGGILSKKCSHILKNFFKKKRKL